VGVLMLSISIDQVALLYSRSLSFAGAGCDLSTNSVELVCVLENLSAPNNSVGENQFTMRIAVDETSPEVAAHPHFRGLHHVVTASFGRSNIFVFDVLRRTLSATVSGAVARDHRFWKEKLIPITLGVLGAAMGVVPVHCACLEFDGSGLLIAGVSGAGKSTLSVALSKIGLNYVSDDWTYVSKKNEKILAYGTSAPVKLLPDAATHFHELDQYRPHISMNGELAYEVGMSEAFGATIEHGCEPRWLVFLQRMQSLGSSFAKLSSVEAKNYLVSNVERLPSQLVEADEKRRHIIDRIAGLPCWSFQYGGTPQFASERLREFVVTRNEELYL
jgi:hypothetical protein